MLVRLDLSEAGIERGLIVDCDAQESRTQKRGCMVDHLAHVEATEARATVPSFRRLPAAGARTRWRDGTPADIAGSQLHLDGRSAA